PGRGSTLALVAPRFADQLRPESQKQPDHSRQRQDRGQRGHAPTETPGGQLPSFGGTGWFFGERNTGRRQGTARQDEEGPRDGLARNSLMATFAESLEGLAATTEDRERYRDAGRSRLGRLPPTAKTREERRVARSDPGRGFADRGG